MTKISKINILNRWEKLATSDLGNWISPKAQQIYEFFKDLFDNECRGEYTTSNFFSSDYVITLLRGFKFNTGYGADDGLYMCFCLDMHSVRIDTMTLKEFDSFMMGRCKPYSESEYNWLWYWQRLIATENKPNKRRKAQR